MNPYEPPKTPREAPRSDPRAVRRRAEYLPIEGHVRAIAIVVGVVGLAHVASLFTLAAPSLRAIAEAAYHVSGAALCFVSAYSLHRFRRRGRAALTAWFVGGLTLAVLLWAAFRAFPIAFVLSRAAVLAGILAYLHYHDGALVLDAKHRALVEETPDVDAPVSNTTIVLIVAIGIALNLVTRTH